MPRVSVCIPTYNSARYLGTAIESVLAQTILDYELVVCDNASTDSTPELCRAYENRLRYVRYDELVSQGGNWNRCVELAHGDLVAILHADDEYLPHHLATRVAQFDRHPEAGMAFGAVELVDEGGDVTGAQTLRPVDTYFPAPEFFGEVLMGCVVSPVSPVVTRRAYSEAGRFDENRLWGVDWEMWLRLAARHGISYSAETTARYRIHATSGSATGVADARNAREESAVLSRAFLWIDQQPALARFVGHKPAARQRLALRFLYMAGESARQGRARAAAGRLRSAVRIHPRLALKPTFWALAVSLVAGGSVADRWLSWRAREYARPKRLR